MTEDEYIEPREELRFFTFAPGDTGTLVLDLEKIKRLPDGDMDEIGPHMCELITFVQTEIRKRLGEIKVFRGQIQTAYVNEEAVAEKLLRMLRAPTVNDLDLF